VPASAGIGLSASKPSPARALAGLDQATDRASAILIVQRSTGTLRWQHRLTSW
jgi:hypothetical protein